MLQNVLPVFTDNIVIFSTKIVKSLSETMVSIIHMTAQKASVLFFAVNRSYCHGFNIRFLLAFCSFQRNAIRAKYRSLNNGFL